MKSLVIGSIKQFQEFPHSHSTNLRHSPIYKSGWINHTKARQIQIGITQKPENYGHPGSIRVDSVSQKDVYYINAVDEIIDQYPFKIFNFNSDRGGENINYQIASLLQKLLIKQTKSRSYHSNDNALCETKNGSVIRKNMGWEHIDQKFCDKINDYLKNYSNPYLNFHRPSSYPSFKTNRRVKEISKIRTNIRET